MSKAKGRARAIADVSAGTILASVEIAAPPERVFRALASDEILKWWGTPDTYRTTSWQGDLRPGGRWRTEGVSADGSSFSVEGEFLKVEPPHTLVQTWRADWDGGEVTTLHYHLDAIEGGTRVTLRHEGFGDRVDSCRGHGEGWEMVLGLLDGYLGRREEARYFVCRLIPSRTTFPADMTPQEAEAMGRHVAFWRERLDRGVALVVGPVADPKAAWGICVVRVASEAALRALLAEDPAIVAGLGFRYETLPMARAPLGA